MLLWDCSWDDPPLDDSYAAGEDYSSTDSADLFGLEDEDLIPLNAAGFGDRPGPAFPTRKGDAKGKGKGKGGKGKGKDKGGKGRDGRVMKPGSSKSKREVPRYVGDGCMVLNIDPGMRQRARAALPPGTGASKHLFQCYMNASHGGCLFAKRDGATCPFVHEDPKLFRWSTLTRILAAEHGGPISGPRIPHDLHVASKHVESLKALQAYEDRPKVTNPRAATHNAREARGVPADTSDGGLVTLGPDASGKAC